MKAVCGVKVIVVQVMAFFREMDVEVDVIASRGVVASLQFDDVDFDSSGGQVLALAFWGVFLLGRIALMQPESAEQATAARAAGADFEPAVFLGEFFHDLERFSGWAEAMVRGRDAADAGMRRLWAERQPVVDAELKMLSSMTKWALWSTQRLGKPMRRKYSLRPERYAGYQYMSLSWGRSKSSANVNFQPGLMGGRFCVDMRRVSPGCWDMSSR